MQRAASVGHLITDRFPLGRRQVSRACVRARFHSREREEGGGAATNAGGMTEGMLTFLRILAGTRPPIHGVADDEDDPAGDQRGEQHHQAGHAHAIQHACRTRRVLHLQPRATNGVSAGTCRESTAHRVTYNNNNNGSSTHPRV